MRNSLGVAGRFGPSLEFEFDLVQVGTEWALHRRQRGGGGMGGRFRTGASGGRPESGLLQHYPFSISEDRRKT